MTPKLSLRYAQTDDDIIAIHRFLCVVAGPTLPGPIDPAESIGEIERVVKHDCALMAIKDDRLVGSFGIIRPKCWWGKVHFLVNRWFFALPGMGAGKLLLKEARAIAEASALELHVFDEAKERYVIFNRNPRRDARDFNPIKTPGHAVARSDAAPPTLQ